MPKGRLVSLRSLANAVEKRAKDAPQFGSARRTGEAVARGSGESAKRARFMEIHLLNHVIMGPANGRLPNSRRAGVLT